MRHSNKPLASAVLGLGLIAGVGGCDAGVGDELVGTWCEYSRDSDELVRELVFRDDASFADRVFDDDGVLRSTQSGAYELDGLLELRGYTHVEEDSSREWSVETTDYYASDTSLVLFAALRHEQGVGIVGQWSGSVSGVERRSASDQPDVSVDKRSWFEFRADQTVSCRFEEASDDQRLEGTYEAHAPDQYLLTLQRSEHAPTVEMTVGVVEGQALVGGLAGMGHSVLVRTRP